jgi:hypothetical protein
MVSCILHPKNKFGSMDNISYLWIDVEILADRHELEQEIFNEINLVISG